MGDYAELSLEQDEFEDTYSIHKSIPKKIKYNYLWRTKNGQLINIKDMTDNHLLNAYNKLVSEKRGINFQKYFKNEIDKRMIS